jgi:hypothetical protein
MTTLRAIKPQERSRATGQRPRTSLASPAVRTPADTRTLGRPYPLGRSYDAGPGQLISSEAGTPQR